VNGHRAVINKHKFFILLIYREREIKNMNMNEYIAAEVAKNAAGEYEAIEGYLRLLNIQGMSKELADDIREIISDEMNHGEKLARWVVKLTGIQPAKD